MNRPEVIENLRKILNFYQSLGFERLPVGREKGSRGPESSGPGVMEKKKGIPSPGIPGTEREYGAAEKARRLEGVREEIGDCLRCRLSKGRKHIVFGEGNPGAALMFIGEGPGREEDNLGRPFVGDAGKVLTKLIVKMGLRRDDVYIANIVKCRPPMNRDPADDEIDACGSFLEQQIDIIQPKVIVALGRVAAQTLLRSRIPISRLRGSFHDFRGIPVMPTFHPAYLIRNPKDKWLTWDDALKVMEKLGKKP